MTREERLLLYLEKRKKTFLCSNFDETTRLYSFSSKDTKGIQGIAVYTDRPHYLVLKEGDSQFKTNDLSVLNPYFYNTINLIN